jgi:hypothetical protein
MHKRFSESSLVNYYSQIPWHVVVHLAKHFKCDDFTAIVSSLSEIEEFKAPIITYIGNINTEGTTFEVCAEGETLCRGRTLQMLFVSHFIFDMKYAQKSHSQLMTPDSPCLLQPTQAPR